MQNENPVTSWFDTPEEGDAEGTLGVERFGISSSDVEDRASEIAEQRKQRKKRTSRAHAETYSGEEE